MATATTEIPLPQSITGSRVVVVGGSSGTGAAAVRLLAGSGAHVLVMGRSGTRPDGADAGPGTVRTAVADMLDEGALRAALEGEVVFLVVRDQDVSREWYRDVVRAKVTRTRDPVILRLGGATLILNEGGGPPPTSRTWC